MSQAAAPPSAWAPLKVGAFRLLWATSLSANVCTWMNDVAAAWLMSQLTPSPLWISMVQTAALLPVFILGLPSGALADRWDRVTLLLGMQVWVTVNAIAFGLATFLRVLTPEILLILVFCNGVGLALRLPVLAALMPQLIPRPQLPSAMALNAASTNASRMVGPILAGVIISAAGAEWVFALNTLLGLVGLWALASWRHPPQRRDEAPERLQRSMRLGLQYVLHSRSLKGVLLRTVWFFLCGSALLALLPLFARQLGAGSAQTFAALMAAMGCGALILTAVLPHLRRRYGQDALVLRGTLALGLSTLAIAWTGSLVVAIPCMLVAGAAWIAVGNTLSVASSLGLPDWIRARGMSVNQVALMGAGAAGATIWGQVAVWVGAALACSMAASLLMLGIAVLVRWRPDTGSIEDLTPARADRLPEAMQPPGRGRVVMEIEYRVCAERVDSFEAFMLNECRESRLRSGCIAWELQKDLTLPDRFVEVVVDASWQEHVRHFDRVTASDQALRAKRLGFHAGPAGPQVRRYLQLSTL